MVIALTVTAVLTLGLFLFHQVPLSLAGQMLALPGSGT